MKERLSGPEFLSPKAASCLSEFTQIWREKPAKPLRLGVFSGKSFRHGEKIRLARARPGFAPPAWRETRSTLSVSAQETRYPHEMDTGLKSLATCGRAQLTCGVTG